MQYFSSFLETGARLAKVLRTSFVQHPGDFFFFLRLNRVLKQGHRHSMQRVSSKCSGFKKKKKKGMIGESMVKCPGGLLIDFFLE